MKKLVLLVLLLVLCFVFTGSSTASGPFQCDTGPQGIIPNPEGACMGPSWLVYSVVTGKDGGKVSVYYGEEYYNGDCPEDFGMNGHKFVCWANGEYPNPGRFEIQNTLKP